MVTSPGRDSKTRPVTTDCAPCSGLGRKHDLSLSRGRPHLGCFAKTSSPARRRIRSTRFVFTVHPTLRGIAVNGRCPWSPCWRANSMMSADDVGCRRRFIVERRRYPAQTLEEIRRRSRSVNRGRLAVLRRRCPNLGRTNRPHVPSTATHGGTRFAQGRAASKAAPAAMAASSRRWPTTICMPMGRPARVKPAGTESAGNPTAVAA